MTKQDKPNILVLQGDDIGWWNISYNGRRQMGYCTPNIDRVANQGVVFTGYYAQQSFTAGRAAFITGQNPIRTGLTTVAMPGADIGLRPKIPPWLSCSSRMATPPASLARTILGDKDEIPADGACFDEFFGPPVSPAVAPRRGCWRLPLRALAQFRRRTAIVLID